MGVGEIRRRHLPVRLQIRCGRKTSYIPSHCPASAFLPSGVNLDDARGMEVNSGRRHSTPTTTAKSTPARRTLPRQSSPPKLLTYWPAWKTIATRRPVRGVLESWMPPRGPRVPLSDDLTIAAACQRLAKPSHWLARLSLRLIAWEGEQSRGPDPPTPVSPSGRSARPLRRA